LQLKSGYYYEYKHQNPTISLNDDMDLIDELDSDFVNLINQSSVRNLWEEFDPDFEDDLLAVT